MDHRPTPRAEVGAFLRARRAELTPAAVGLPGDGTQRRVPGLRRDEVARLASISVDYYTRIEQGRLRLTGSVLPALARALHLDEQQQAYLDELAGRPPSRGRRRPAARQVRQATRRLLDQLDRSPALVLGRFNDVLAWNQAASALYLDFAELAPDDRNYTRLLFLDPRFRELYPDWEEAGRVAAATLRMEAATAPDDPRLAALVGELTVRSPEFRAWWSGRVVSNLSFGRKRFRHPVVGPLSLDCETWSCPDDPDQRLMVLTAELGSPSDEALRILTSWASQPRSHHPG